MLATGPPNPDETDRLTREETGLDVTLLIPRNDLAKAKRGGEPYVLVLPDDEDGTPSPE